MTLQLNTCADPGVDERFLWDRYDNQPMVALYDALNFFHDRIEFVMALIMDPRCGIERRAEAGLPRHLLGKTPLVFAIYAARVDVAKALLAAGADPNATEDLYDSSPLLVAAGEGNLEAIESLISYGADINATDEEGSTPLHVAVRCGHPSAMELLVRSGANLEAVDNEGCTPLHLAAFSNKAGAIMVLLKLGANQAAVDNEGRTPLHVVAEQYHVLFDVIYAFRFNVTAFEANLRAVDKHGRTPLQVYGPGAVYGVDSIIPLLTPKYRNPVERISAKSRQICTTKGKFVVEKIYKFYKIADYSPEYQNTSGGPGARGQIVCDSREVEKNDFLGHSRWRICIPDCYRYS